MIFNKNELEILKDLVDKERLKMIEQSRKCNIYEYDFYLDKVAELVTIKFKLEDLYDLENNFKSIFNNNYGNTAEKQILKQKIDDIVHFQQELACKIGFLCKEIKDKEGEPDAK